MFHLARLFQAGSSRCVLICLLDSRPLLCRTSLVPVYVPLLFASVAVRDCASSSRCRSSYAKLYIVFDPDFTDTVDDEVLDAISSQFLFQLGFLLILPIPLLLAVEAVRTACCRGGFALRVYRVRRTNSYFVYYGRRDRKAKSRRNPRSNR